MSLNPVNFLLFIPLKFSPLHGATTMNSTKHGNIISTVKTGGVQFFKAASLYGWKALNHVRMLVVHLAVAVCVLHWRVGSDPGCVTSLAQNCHSSRVLLQATLHLHANASH